MIPTSESEKWICETKRLRLFLSKMQPAGHNDTRDVWIAFRIDEDRPMVCATAVIWDCPPLGGYNVSWAEVSTEHRRQGVWTEMREAIEKYYGVELISDAATDEGEAFLAAWSRRRSPGNL